MIESYFFIPGSHPKLQEKIASIKADYIIIDLEDAVLKSNIQTALKALDLLKTKQTLWIRPKIFESGREQFETIKELLKQGFRNFIIPKIRNLEQLKNLESFVGNSMINELNIMILVENPACLINLNEIITKSSFDIEGIGFGSQDYCTETGMKHTLDLLKVPRFQIMNIAKANGIKSIDIACMDSKAGDIFTNELKEAFDMGFDGKFLIHPAQLEKLKRFPFYSKEEVVEAKSILNEHDRLQQPAVFVFKDKAIEPPHIKQYQNIIEWSINHEIK